MKIINNRVMKYPAVTVTVTNLEAKADTNADI